MPNYRRVFRPRGTFFLTLVTERRAPIFDDEPARGILHDAMEFCRRHHPFVLDAIVLPYERRRSDPPRYEFAGTPDEHGPRKRHGS